MWLTGLPSSGKTTLARAIRERLGGRPSCVLDGDELRRALVPQPGYDQRGREDFYASLGNIAALLARQDLVVLVPATAHRRHMRARARAAAPRFVEVHVATPAAECAARDPKGLWARAAGDRDSALPGAGVEYEPPHSADVTASGGYDGAAAAAVVELVVRDLRDR